MNGTDPSVPDPPINWAPKPANPGKPRHFRGFLLRGLAVVLPPILTIAILIWVANIVNEYVLVPVHGWVRYVAAKATMDARERRDLAGGEHSLPAIAPWGTEYRLTKQLAEKLTPEAPGASTLAAELTKLAESLNAGRADDDAQFLLARYGEDIFVPVGNRYVPLHVYQRVAQHEDTIAQTPPALYEQYVSYISLPGVPWLSLPNLGSLLVLLILLVGIYFAGHFLALGIGRALWHLFEARMVFRLPLVRNVYSSVKQVTDFILSERQVQYSRVVAVQYPRRGVWSLGFVTSESMKSIEEAAGEPVVSVLIPTSPLPMTGYTINLPRSEVLDVNLTVDQAIQFCISCGVVIPLAELPKSKAEELLAKQSTPLQVAAEQQTAD